VRRRIRLYAPQTFHPSATQTAIPIEFVGGLAVAPAELTPPGATPIPCRVVVDTGLRTTVTWYHPFVVARDLVATQPRVVTGTVGGGAGGESTGDGGRLAQLRIGAVTVERPTVVFSRDTAGVFAGRDADGIVGGELLRRYRVTFDYSRKVLYLEPNSGAPSAFDYDMSGLFLVARGPDLKGVAIQSVASDSPAAEAGLRKGDEIATVDGRSVAKTSLDELRELLKHDGATHRLGIRRGDAAMEVTLTLRRLV
jgi:membrane-associated protease RseP (regulator of RpoE activity)